jgi:hypothetical protein
MARRVFFSFHYQADIWRVSQVRNSWLMQNGESNRFMDAAAWEKVKRKGEASITAWIDEQLNGTSVTVVLIGGETASRRYVRYEIEESYERGNGLLGIYINRIRDREGYISAKGPNPLARVRVEVEAEWWDIFGSTRREPLTKIFETYDWVKDDGRQNMGQWIEKAARHAGR